MKSWMVLCSLTTLGACVPYDPPGDAALTQRVDDAVGPRNGTLPQRALAPKKQAPEPDVNERNPTAPKSGGPIPLSVALLRQRVLEDNLKLKALRLGPAIAQAKLDAERAKFDAVFVARAGLSEADKARGPSTLYGVKSPGVADSSGTFTQLEQDRTRGGASVGLVQPLPTGGTLAIEQQIESDEKSAGALRSKLARSALNFSFSQPLLRGAGVRVNTASIRLAELGRQSVSLTTKLSAIRLIANAEKAYWRAYAAEKRLEVRREQLRIATDLQQFVRERINAGVEAAIAQVAADLSVAQQRANVVTAETAVRIRQRELRRVMNQPLDSRQAYSFATEPSLVAFELNAPQLVGLALRNRMELLEVEVQLAADMMRIELAENATLPMFALDFRYGLEQSASSIHSAFVDQFDLDHHTVSIGVSGSIPITNDRAEARLREAVLTRKRRLRTQELRELAIRQEVLDARDVMEQYWQSILAERQSVVAAGLNLQAERDQLAIGTQTTQDIAIALNLLGSAQIREIDAIVDYQVAQLDLAFATGTLLGYAGMRMDPLPLGVDR